MLKRGLSNGCQEEPGCLPFAPPELRPRLHLLKNSSEDRTPRGNLRSSKPSCQSHPCESHEDLRSGPSCQFFTLSLRWAFSRLPPLSGRGSHQEPATSPTSRQPYSGSSLYLHP